MKAYLNIFGSLWLSLCLLWSHTGHADMQGQTVFIPIAVGDITIFIPIMPSTASGSVSTTSVEGSYSLTWAAVSNASYYQIIITDENGAQRIIRVTNTSYSLAGLSLGSNKIEIQACNASNQCGVGYLAGMVTRSSNIIYQHTDMLGSVVAQTDAAGNITSRSHYEPFGKRIGGDKPGIGYTGHLQDEDLGLTYMQQRYYDPVIGRFYSNDPVGFTGEPDTFNRYSYVANNPYKYTDPTGEEKYSIGLSGEAMLVAGVRVGFSVSFDTETLELGGSANAGPRLGVGLSLKPSVSIEQSGTEAVNKTTTEITVNADAGVGPLSVGKDLVSEKAINGVHQTQVSISEPEAKGGASASVGVDFKIEQTSTVIKDAVDNIKEVLK